MRTLAFASALVAALFCTSTHSFATDLNLLCKTELTQPNGAQTDLFRQYQINLDTGEVTVWDNYGRGFQRQFTTTYNRANTQIIVVAQTSVVYHEINRVTGMMFSIDRGERKRGICNRSQ